MTHQLTLELPEDVYLPLASKAQEMGQSVEATATACLAESLGAAPPGSRLRRWAGAFDSGVPDAATRHHDYLGKALADDLQGRPDA